MVSNLVSALSDNVSVDTEKCLGCGECVDRCILDNLRLEQAPCGHACPLEINAQGYAQLIKRGQPEDALRQIYKKTPFAGLLGYLCNHPCETACSRNEVDQQGVSLRALKRYLYETVSLAPEYTPECTAKGRCAIIGGGPAGLSAAWYLAQAGCEVTIYEAEEQLGGIPAQAIPAFRIPDEVLRQQCALVTDLGVTVHTGVRVGTDLPFQAVLDEYDAVFVATGAPAARRLPQDTGTLEGLHYALDFLRQAKKGVCAGVGFQVLVVGGGDVAIDAAQVAKRMGAEEVTILSLETLDQLPASADTLREAQQAGIHLSCGWGVQSIEAEGNRVRGIKARQCVQVYDQEGRFAPTYDDSVQRDISADTVILAIGQQTDLDFLAGAVAVEQNQIQSDPLCRQSNQAKVFAGGDCVSGPNTLVHALADGRRASESILRYLNGDDVSYGRDNSQAYLHDFEVDLTAGSPAARIDTTQGGGERTLTEEEAQTEASRCLGCGKPIGYRKTCWMCLPCEVQCPQDALTIKIHYIMA
ncbi:MAG: FAD-dependent oxidoreductase [Oscillospiraceae bacterium]|nr:FAD-dependent oxidoreductase [Oscillospiraceae bacterium]